MRRDTENRVENYIKKHKNYKRWLAFALCIALFTGTVTLYMLNKPATAMTEDGAEEVGLVLETADNDFEQGLIEQMENGDHDEDSDTSNVEESSIMETDEESTEEQTADDSSKAVLETSEDAGISSLADESDKSETSSSAASASSFDEKATGSASSEASSAASVNDGLTDAEKIAALNVPQTVNVSDYITSTIIERRLSDGSWEVIEREDIEEGDWIRVTYLYDIPDTAKLSDDIYLDIPEELDFIDIEKATVLDGTGTAEVSDDSKILIDYDAETKKEILDEATESDDFHASISLPEPVASFFSIFAPLKVYAEDSGVSYEGMALKSLKSTATTDGKFLVDAVALTKWDESTNSWIDVATDDSTDGHTEASVSIANGDKLRFELHYVVKQGTLDSSSIDLA